MSRDAEGLPSGVGNGAAEGAVAVHRLPPGLRADLADALHPAFGAAACVSALVWVVAFLGVKEVPLRSSFDEPVERRIEEAVEIAAVDASGAPR